MPQFTFEGPDGQQHTIEGPEGAKSEDAFRILQQHLGQNLKRETPGILKSAASGMIEGAGAPGDLSQKVLSGAPPQQPIDRDTYYGKLVDALNTARKYLELPTSHGIGNAVGMQPTQPVTGAERAVQMGGRILGGLPMSGANAGGRAAMGYGSAANAVRGMGMSPSGPVSSIAANPGVAAQNGFLQQAAKEALHVGGHAMGGPIGGLAARFAPKILGLE